MTKSTPPFILIDGSSYLFRAYHALPPLTTTKGQPTGAIYGVVNMLRKLAQKYKPEHIAVVFDAKGKTFRHDMYPEYKANRPEMPEELASQIQPLHNFVRAMGFPLLLQQGVEADDIIGTLAQQAEKVGMTTLISTGDKDFAQLVNSKITLINTMTNKSMDIEGVVEKFGVAPEQIIDYLALMGDTVDNVPGVDKVGPKTAAKWLQQYQSLENIEQHADEFKGKVGEYLREALPRLGLSQELVTIKCDVELEQTPEQLSMTEPDYKKLVELCTELEFSSWLKEFSTKLHGGEVAAPAEKKLSSYQCILTQKEFDAWLKKLNAAKQFALDTETTSVHAMQADLVGISFSTETGDAAYLPLHHDYMGVPQQLSVDTVLSALKPIVQDPNKTIIGQNLKYDIKVLANAGLELKAPYLDTMLQSYVLTGSSTRHDMDSLALRYLGRETIHYEDVAGTGKNQLTFNQVNLDDAVPYAAEDADVTLQLKQTLSQKLAEDADLQKVFNEIEMPLMPILAEMERCGVLLDVNLLQQQSQQLAQRIAEIEKEIYAQAGEEFNIASTKQLGAIFYEKLKLPVLKKTPKGAPATNEAVLQELALDYPLPKLILQFRSLTKLKSTYVDALPEQVNAKTDRVHTSYNQALTATGRLSSKDPNLQNIPVRTEEGRAVRKAFIAPEHGKILSADYSQIELRIMAHLSKDKGLLDAFSHGMDVHRATAAEVFGVAPDEVTDLQRRRAKAINFGLIYGMSAFGLAKQLGIERAEAQHYIDIYFERYPGVLRFMEETRELAHAQGYVSTIFGRKLWMPNIHSSNKMQQKAAERAAINAPMQGSAADIIKLAMIRMHEWLKASGLNIRMIMQVHDELVFEVAEKDVAALEKGVRECMQGAATLDVPLIVDIGVGDNWDEAH